jgi:YD repeat-containing protein
VTEVHDATGLVATYSYDAFNRRVAKTVGGATTETVWTGWQALEEYRAGVLSARRSFGLGLDEMVRVEADVEGDGTLESTYHPIYDSTGNLVMVLGPDGEPIELYAYSPNGERQVIVNDLTPPAVEQVRVSGGAIVVELSEEADIEALAAAVAEGDVTLTDLTDPGVPAAVPFTASWPVTEGPQARRRLVLTPGTAPVAGTALELTIAAEALEDLFGNATTAASTDALTWPAADAIVRDTTAPRIESVSVEQGNLVVVLSEPADPTAAAAGDGSPDRPADR